MMSTTSWDTGFWSLFIKRRWKSPFVPLEINVVRKIEIPVSFRGHQVGIFEADMMVNDVLLLELKAVRTLDSAHEAQLLNYLQATPSEIGLLMNFGLKPEFKRLIFDNVRKRSRGDRSLAEDRLLSTDVL
jgi:GxxExxY protein